MYSDGLKSRLVVGFSGTSKLEAHMSEIQTSEIQTLNKPRPYGDYFFMPLKWHYALAASRFKTLFGH